MASISIIIPSFNHARYITAAIESVLDQTIGDLELVVIDDGSVDGTPQILSKIQDPRMKVFFQENQGAHAAINRGIQNSTGNYVGILNSDDVYSRTRLERLLSMLEEDGSMGVVGSYLEVIDSQGNPLGIKQAYHSLEPWMLENPERSFRRGDSLRAALLTENYWATSSNFFFRRDVYEKIGPFRNLRYAHDWDFLLRITKDYQIDLVPEPLLQYRVHERNTIRENTAAMIFEICWCLAVHLPDHIEQPWYSVLPLDQRADQLLHSIYTFNFDRVLNVLLLHRISRDLDHAFALLETNNPTRLKLLEYITSRLETEDNPVEDSSKAQLDKSSQSFLQSLKSIWRNGKRFLKVNILRR